MNIFYFSKNPKECADYHCTKHTIKMIVEYAQLLSTAHHVLDKSNNPNIYKQTHVNHPSSIWVRQSIENYNYVATLALHLCKNYSKLSNKQHKTESVLKYLFENPPLNIPKKPQTRIIEAMPDEYICINPIDSYRNYFNNEKKHLFDWKYSSIPDWVNLKTGGFSAHII